MPKSTVDDAIGKMVAAIGSQAAPPAVLLVRTDAALPQRRSRRAACDDDATPGARLLAALGRAAQPTSPRSALGVEIALEAMAPASKLAVAADLDCWLDWCAVKRCAPCFANAGDLVRYLRALEADGKKPATLSRRIDSLATANRLLGTMGDALPTSSPMVGNAFRGKPTTSANGAIMSIATLHVRNTMAFEIRSPARPTHQPPAQIPIVPETIRMVPCAEATASKHRRRLPIEPPPDRAHRLAHRHRSQISARCSAE